MANILLFTRETVGLVATHSLGLRQNMATVVVCSVVALMIVVCIAVMVVVVISTSSHLWTSDWTF